MKPEVSNDNLSHPTNIQRGVSVYGRHYVFEVSRFLTSNADGNDSKSSDLGP